MSLTINGEIITRFHHVMEPRMIFEILSRLRSFNSDVVIFVWNAGPAFENQSMYVCAPT